MVGRNLLTQLVLKPTVYCFHRCGYCQPRQDYYTDMVRAGRAQAMSAPAMGSIGRRNPGHLPLEVALAAVEEAAGLGMRSLQLSGGDPLLYPHLLEVVRAGAAHPGVFVFMNSVGTGVTRDRACRIIEAGLGAWNFSVDTLDGRLYDGLRGVRGAFNRVRAAIGEVQRAAGDSPGFYVNYMAVLPRRSFRGLPALVAHCVDTGVASVHLMTEYGDTVGESLLRVADIAEWRAVTVPAVLQVLRDRDLPDVVVDNAERVMAVSSPPTTRTPTTRRACTGRRWRPRTAGAIPRTSTAWSSRTGRCCRAVWVEVTGRGQVGRLDDQSLTAISRGEAYQRFRRQRMAFCQRCPAPSTAPWA